MDRKRVQIPLVPHVEHLEQIPDALLSMAAFNCIEEIKKMLVIHFAIVGLRALKHSTDELFRQQSVLVPIRKMAKNISKPFYIQWIVNSKWHRN